MTLDERNAAEEASQRKRRQGAFGVLLTVAYDGHHFSGFVRQDNARTIAGELDGAIRTIDPKAAPVIGVSRTDAGVHSAGNPAVFRTDRDLSSRSWVLALSQHLPDEISVVRAAKVVPDFDPRPHALFKRYRYRILASKVRDPFLEGRAWRVHNEMDLEAMQTEAAHLVGEHDFAAFRSARDERETTVRRLHSVVVAPAVGDVRSVDIEVTGNRFLYNMVRIIAGTIVDVGRGRLKPGAVLRALESKRREDLGMTAPPDGLYLEHVELDETGEEVWPPDESA